MMAHTFMIGKWKVSVGDIVNENDVLGTYVSPREENMLICNRRGRVSYLARAGV
jgi:hypothetical protein